MLWAITSYFNPAGYQTKKRNYDRFREALAVPLVSVELAHAGFELGPDDADQLIQLRGGDVLWQKERLLNLALAALPAACTAVAWLDADLLFGNPAWPAQTLAALEDKVCVQLFEDVVELEQNQSAAEGLSPQRAGIARAWCRQQMPGDYFSAAGASCRTRLTPGLAWAARRELLDREGLYEAMILGGGDRAIFNAMLGQIEAFVASYRLSPAHAAHYRAWAAGFHARVQGRVGYVPGRLTHLWHGSRSHRQYQSRRELLPGFGFDPAGDLGAEPGQAWRWASDKPGLHATVADYFAQRQEDGEAFQASSSPKASIKSA